MIVNSKGTDKFICHAAIVGPVEDVRPITEEIRKRQERDEGNLRQMVVLLPGGPQLLGKTYYEESAIDYPEVYYVLQEYRQQKALGSSLVYLSYGKGSEDQTVIWTPLFDCEGRTCESLREVFENECRKRYQFDIKTQHNLYTRAELKSDASTARTA